MRIREIAVSLMCLTASIFLGCGKVGKAVQLNAEKQVVARTATLKTDSEAICRESAASGSAAMKKKYAGTITEISGTVAEIEESEEWIELHLAGPCPSDYRVQCLFSDNQRALVKQIKQNQHVTVKGLAGPSPSFFSLHGCILVR